MPSAGDLPLIGRERELADLLGQIILAAAGSPRLVLLTGDAGVGKSRLANEAVATARERGWLTLTGKCLRGDITPYHPISEALRDGKLEHLMEFSKPPRIEQVFIIYKDGRLIFKSSRKDGGLDADIFAGMLSVVGTFVRDSISAMTGEKKGGGLNVLGYENYRILLENRAWGSLAIILTGQETEVLKGEMTQSMDRIDSSHGLVLRNWNGEKEQINTLRPDAEWFLNCGKYDGIDEVTEPENRHWRLLSNVTYGLSRLAHERPVLIFIDDIHWADPGSVEMLLHLMRQLKGEPFRAMATCRPEQLGDRNTFADAMKELESHGQLAEIHIGKLEGSEVRGMVAEELGETLARGALGALIERESGGNANLVREMLDWLREEGVVIREAGDWKLARPVERIGVPRKVEEALKARLGRLTKEERQTLDAAAVVGEVFKPAMVATLLGASPIQVHRIFHEVERTHKLVRAMEGGSVYRFDHRLVREVVYAAMPEALRVECHRAAAEILSKEGGTGISHLTELAQHAAAGKHPRAARPLRAAGDATRLEYQNAAAVRLYAQALELSPRDERGEIAELLGETEVNSGHFEEADVWFAMAARETRYRDRRLALVSRRARVLDRLGRMGEAYRILEDERPGPTTPPIIEARWRSVRAWLLLRQLDCDKAETEVREALSIFQKMSGSSEDILDCYNTLGATMAARGNLGEAASVYRESLEMAKGSGMGGEAVRLMINLANIEPSLGQLRDALATAREALRESDRIGNRLFIASSLYSIGLSLLCLGNPREAEGYLTAAFKLADDIKASAISTEARELCALCALETGRKNEAEVIAREAIRVSGADYPGTTPFLTLSEILVENGKAQEGESLARAAVERHHHQRANAATKLAMRTLALTVAAQGRRRESEVLFEQAVEQGREALGAFDLAKGLRWWGEALASWGDIENARRKLEEARRMFASMDASLELKKTEKAIRKLEN